MRILPALDIKGGDCVQLVNGNESRESIRLSNPLYYAHRFAEYGAQALHLVDLDKALGVGENDKIVNQIVRETRLDVQVGGGIRGLEEIEDHLSAGASKVVLGTKCFSDPEWFEMAVSEYGGRIISSIDAKEDLVLTHGWNRSSSFGIIDAITMVKKMGVNNVLYTDISRDGALIGPNIKMAKTITSIFPEINFQISGGVSSVRDIDAVSTVGGVSGLVVGTGIYNGSIPIDVLKMYTD